MPRLLVAGSISCLLWLSACSQGGGASAPATPARLVVSASTTVIDPATDTPPAVGSAEVDGARLDRHYRVTTPADAPFAFDLIAWAPGAVGAAQIAVRHLRDGGTTPTTVSSLIDAGVQLQGQGLFRGNGWLSANGDGYARMSIRGRITRDQLLAVNAENGSVVLVEIAIGEPSVIQRPDGGGAVQLPAGATRQTLYSSAAWNFGLPAVAVSGDRTSVVCYEGDQFQANWSRRFELRMQHAAATGAVTGGASVEWSADTGNWRDHEAFARWNVLGVVRSEDLGVRVRLSFDRGATFLQDALVVPGHGSSRLVQAAMADDYRLAVAAWRQAPDGSGQQFVLVEGWPLGFDANGSPTWFAFDAPQVVFTAPLDSNPLTTGIAWSAGGDLVIGYGASWFVPGATWVSTTDFRCATRRNGGPLVDVEVDQEVMFGMDPSVAVTGQGPTLRVFYGYESRQGVQLVVSEDGGQTFGGAEAIGSAGDHQPTVLVREVGGATAVDVLYLAPRAEGLELHRAHWDDWGHGARVDSTLTQASMQAVSVTPPSGWSGPWFPNGLRTTQVNWLGYDAVLDGTTIVVVYDEVTFDNVVLCLGAPTGPTATTAGSLPNNGLSAPPPLAPGLTEPLRTPDANDMHQLVLLRLP